MSIIIFFLFHAAVQALRKIYEKILAGQTPKRSHEIRYVAGIDG